MGVDLYGRNPVLVSEQPKINWGDCPSKEETDKYWEDYKKFRSENVGFSFSNNWWYWRPLWEFVCVHCEDILDEDDIEGGGWNDGHYITKRKAKKIGEILQGLISSGFVRGYAKEREDKIKKLPDVQCSHCDGRGIRDDQYVQGICNGCSGLGKVKHRLASYPFCPDNLAHFAEFALSSGGFEIR